MFLVGLTALAQMTVIPGALLLKCFPDEDRNLLEAAIYAFALSLTANGILVPLLVLLNSYTATALWLIIGLEMALLVRAGVLRRHRWSPTVEVAGLGDIFRPKGFLLSLATIAAIATIFAYARINYQSWGSVFDSIDDVANWDRWACAWAAGQFPVGTWNYPQLVPANWSLTYVLLGTMDVKMFAKAVCPVFGLLVLLLFASLASRRDRLGHLLALSITGWLFLHYIGLGFLTSGYTDVPLAFFCFAAFYPFYVRRRSPDPACASMPGLDTSHWLGLTVVSGAMLVKQGAIFALVACLVWFLLQGVRGGWKSLWPTARSSSTVGLLALSSVAVWYAYKYTQIHYGLEASNVSALMTGIHGGRGYPARLVAAGLLIWHSRGMTGPMVAPIIGCFYVIGSLVRPSRSVSLWLATPFLAAWGLWFSYEIRTASPAVPFVGLVTAFGITYILELLPFRPLPGIYGTVGAAVLSIAAGAYMYWHISGYSPPAIHWLTPFFQDMWAVGAIMLYSQWLLLAGLLVLVMSIWGGGAGTARIWWPEAGLAVLAILVAHTSFRWDTILHEQAVLLRRNGVPALNDRIYRAAQEFQIHSGIVTSYWPLRSLPTVGHWFRWPVWNSPCPFSILRTVPLAVPDAGYILIPEGDLDDATRSALASSADLRTLFIAEGFRMIQIVRR